MSGYQSDPSTPDEGAHPYGSMPPPSAGEAFAARPEPPQEVQKAATILYITAAWGLVGLVISFFTIEDAVRDATPTLTDAEVSTAVTGGLIFASIFALAFAFLYFLCGRKMLEGRNWARIVPTVLIGIGLLFSLLGLGTGQISGVSLVSLVISLALGAAFLFFAWRRPSSEFFKAARAPR